MIEDLSDLNVELREQVRDLTGQVERLLEENRTLQAGRRGTRGASVPRSPRLGPLGAGVASPRNGIGQMGRVWGRGSRGNSPAPGVGGGIGESALGSGVGQGPHRGTFVQGEMLGAGNRFARG